MAGANAHLLKESGQLHLPFHESIVHRTVLYSAGTSEPDRVSLTDLCKILS
jgi:hypothetical protein